MRIEAPRQIKIINLREKSGHHCQNDPKHNMRCEFSRMGMWGANHFKHYFIPDYFLMLLVFFASFFAFARAMAAATAAFFRVKCG